MSLASYDDQIDRRYLKLAFDEISPVRDVRLLQGVVSTLCGEVGIPAPQPDLIARLVHASRKRFGRFIENTLGALETAALSGSSNLETSHFAENWALNEGAEIGESVFYARDWAQIDLSKKAASQLGKKRRS